MALDLQKLMVFIGWASNIAYRKAFGHCRRAPRGALRGALRGPFVGYIVQLPLR